MALNNSVSSLRLSFVKLGIVTLTYFTKWVVQDPTEKSPLYDLEAVLVVCINYFFPHTETLTSQVAAKLLISYSKPTMRTWLMIPLQVSLQEWVTS